MDVIEKYDEKLTQEIATHYKEILRLLGEDTEREGLIRTPERAAKAIQYVTKGYAQEPEEIIKSALFKENYHQMVVIKDIDFHSTCEHHIMPFFGKCHVAYIPDGTIIGLSKIPRVVECFARRLQVQERLTEQIMSSIQKAINPLGVAVMIEAQHTCVSMRGVQKQQATAVTSAYCGVFLEDEKKRNEFLERINKK